jgi:hypothetical protein
MNRYPHAIEPKTLPKPCVDLNSLIHTLDMPDSNRKVMADAMNAIMEDTTRRRRILSLVQEALDQLRLDVKYLMFDLEATRRERDEALEKFQ